MHSYEFDFSWGDFGMSTYLFSHEMQSNEMPMNIGTFNKLWKPYETFTNEIS